jgi:hypothetical protein
MGTNKHARDRVETGHTTPPSGHDRMTDESHALRAGRKGPTPRKQVLPKEESTREAGSDDRRSGSDSNRS